MFKSIWVSKLWNCWMSAEVWPFNNLVKILSLDDSCGAVAEKTNNNHNESIKNRYTWYHELLNRHLRLVTYLIVAYLSYTASTPPRRERLSSSFLNELIMYWLPIIMIRDILITVVFYGGWHCLLYESNLIVNKMKHLKFNPKYPNLTQWKHDKFWTINGTIISSLFEIIFIYLTSFSRINEKLSDNDQ